MMNKQINKVFVPFSEDLLAAAGSPLGELVPYQLEYRCVRLLDGTFEFDFVPPSAESAGTLQKQADLVHAA